MYHLNFGNSLNCIYKQKVKILFINWYENSFVLIEI